MKCRKPIVTISADLYQRAGAFLFKYEWIPDYIAVPVLDFLDGVVEKHCNCDRCTLNL